METRVSIVSDTVDAMTFIPPVDVELMLERLNVDFHRRGARLLFFRCPWHEERTPSCRIIDDEGDRRHGQVRCYGCNAGGWPMHLVMEMLECSPGEAVEWLKDVNKPPPVPFGVYVDYQTKPVAKRLNLPEGFVTKQLEAWPDKPRRYAESRNLRDWQVIRWNVGYTPKRFNSKTNPHPGRIFVPVFNDKGRLVNYTGRTYVGSERRYKNARVEDGADPAAIFGEQYWPKKRRIVFVTEGAFNAMAIERAFPETSLAALYGSSLHDRHVQKLSTFDAVVIATDPDQAGDGVAEKLYQRLRRWAQVYRLRLDEGRDCDDMPFEDLRARMTEVFGQHNWDPGKRPRKKLRKV